MKRLAFLIKGETTHLDVGK
ncbi:hypothetical protein OJO68_26535 [Escherichia coli]|nr:hypothetical protein [Escherichia coli]MCW3190942.1 hypothetical protein [Escherichia coli]